MNNKKNISLDDFIEKAKAPLPVHEEAVAVPTESITIRPKRKAMKSAGPLIVVKRAAGADDIQKWLSTKPGFIEGLTETDYQSTKLYRYQIDYLIDPNPFKHIDKSRQCLPIGSMVNTPNGPVEIERLIPGDSVYSYNVSTQKIEVDEVTDSWESGVRNCERILTRAGNSLIAGENHPFLMRNFSWKKNKELCRGDKFKNCFGQFGIVSPEESLVKILAYLVTDGCTIPRPKFTNNNVTLINEFMEAVHEFDPKLEFRVGKKCNGFEVHPHCGWGTSKKNSLHHLLIEWELYKKRKENKELPQIVFSWDRNAIVLLLNRMFACDGWYSSPHGEVIGVGLGTSNKRLAYQIQQLLWNFGIDSCVRQTTYAGPDIKYGQIRNFWKVLINYRGSVTKFYNQIGIITKQYIPLHISLHRVLRNDRVIKFKQKVGPIRCFDISVKKNNNFIFQGFVVHNTGYSYIFAAEAVAEAHLMDRHTEIFISINQEEANEKIIYARALYDTIPLAFKKKLVVDNKKSLEFENVSGKRGRTRIISHAQREPRGKGGNTKIILDEAAHYMFGEKIYVAAMPIISRGYGGITIGSTPLGKTGIHWEILANREYHDLYSYFTTYWWDCPEFVGEDLFEAAQIEAAELTTTERVKKYGSIKLRHIFIGMDIESFRQEYECHHIDESVAYFPMGLLKQCMFRIVQDSIFDEDDENAGEVLRNPIEEKHPDTKFDYYTTIDDFLSAIKAGKIVGRLVGGFDVGRRHNTAEFIVFEELKDNLTILRLRRSFRNEPFEIMKGETFYALRNANIRKFGIDATGPGIQLAEETARAFPGVCEEINFTNSWKDESASNLRRLMECQWLALPDDRDFRNQFHSIKRIVTEHGNLRIDAAANTQHHGDIVWGCALACMYIRNKPQINFGDSLRRGMHMDESTDADIKIVRPGQRLFTTVSPMVQQPFMPGGHRPFGLELPAIARRKIQHV